MSFLAENMIREGEVVLRLWNRNIKQGAVNFKEVIAQCTYSVCEHLLSD